MSESKHDHLRAPGQLAYGFIWQLSNAAFHLLGGVEVFGAENVQNRQNGYVQAYNHSSMLDIPTLGMAADQADDQQLYYMSKDENNVLILGYWLGRGGSFYISRATGPTPKQHEWMGTDLFDRNAAVAIAPQGHRYPNNLSRETYKGMILATVAYLHGVEVVPTAIIGTAPGDIGNIHVGYGKPIKAEKADFEPDPEWDVRKYTGELSKAIRKINGPRTVEFFMDDVFKRTVKVHSLIEQMRRERLAETGYTALARVLNSRSAKTRQAL